MTTQPQVSVLRSVLSHGSLLSGADAVHRHVCLAAFLAVLGMPGLVGIMFLTPVASNAVLYAASLLPLAPALAAGLHAVRSWRSGSDLAPLTLLLQGLRLNTVDVLRWWVPALGVGSALALNAFGGTGGVLGPVSLLLLVGLVLLCGHALLVTSAFSFRTRDVLRLSAHLVLDQWRSTLLLGSLIVVAAAVVHLASEAVLVLFAWAFVSVLELSSRPLIDSVKKRFTTSARQ